MSFPCRILRSAKQRPCRPGLAGANDGADFRKAQSKLTRCAAVSGLALSVIASRCHLSQSERPWQSAKFPVPHFTPCCRKGSRRRCAQTFRLCQGLPLWGSWREAPERASPLAARLRLSLAGTCGGAKSHPPPYSTTFSKKYQNPLDFRKLK